MTQIRLDKVQFFSGLETYLNDETLTSDMAVSGSILNGGSQSFFAVINFSLTNRRADLYAKNLNTSRKRPLSGGARLNPYQFASSETADLTALYDSNILGTGPGALAILTVTNNTGSTINLVNQTLKISAVLYEVPQTV